MKTISIILTSTILFSAIHFSNNVAADDKPKIEKEQVGRFTLHTVTQGEEHIIYRIDTVTGNVSVFNPVEKTLISNEDIGKVSEKAEMARDLRAKGYVVLEKPYWKKIPEKLESLFIDLNSKK
jgi:hypothetical protein